MPCVGSTWAAGMSGQLGGRPSVVAGHTGTGGGTDEAQGAGGGQWGLGRGHTGGAGSRGGSVAHTLCAQCNQKRGMLSRRSPHDLPAPQVPLKKTLVHQGRRQQHRRE